MKHLIKNISNIVASLSNHAFSKKIILNFGKRQIIIHFQRSLESKKESVIERVPTEFYEKLDLYRKHYTFMFIEDMHYGAIPHFSFRNNAFSVKLKNEDNVLEAILTDALSDDTRCINLDNAFAEFIEKAAHNLFYYGVAMYEIIIEKDSNNIIKGIELDPIMPLGINKFFGFYIQHIPTKALKRISTKTTLSIFPENRILQIAFPSEFGGRRGFNMTMKKLSGLSENGVFPKFTLESIENECGFDSKMYASSKEKAVAKISKKYGWEQRGAINSKISEYYWVYRRLQLKETKAIVRESVLKHLNLFLRSLAFDNELVLEGLLGVKDFEKLRGELSRGDISIGDFIKKVDN
jgi:hypothetical protein